MILELGLSEVSWWERSDLVFDLNFPFRDDGGGVIAYLGPFRVVRVDDNSNYIRY